MLGLVGLPYLILVVGFGPCLVICIGFKLGHCLIRFVVKSRNGDYLKIGLMGLNSQIFTAMNWLCW